jgi:hypothetical protein
MIKNPYMKILVMEGYYDLATPFAAANWTMDHLDLGPKVSPEYFRTVPTTRDTWCTSIAPSTTR